jgi:zinc-binding in reverse transcriptase
MPLKIKVFLWLVQKKILTKNNLMKRGYIDTRNYIFYNADESIEHLFIHCTVALCLWNWISFYNNFKFHDYCNTIKELWFIHNCIPYKNSNLCELLRGVVLW